MEWALSWPWLALALLGAYHGLNPGMGWLFAVARGLQEGSRGAVLASLVPILIGHEASVVVVVGAAVATEHLLAPPTDGCWQPWSWCRSVSTGSPDLGRTRVASVCGSAAWALPPGPF